VITEPEFLETVKTPPDKSDSDSGVIEVQSGGSERMQVDEQVDKHVLEDDNTESDTLEVDNAAS
jgi:hypothetical protein